jgi:aspartate-semialdehyde dehydrogenase
MMMSGSSIVSTDGYTVAVLGATGLVGSLILALLAERHFPIKRLKLLASKRSAGGTIVFRGQAVTIEEARPEAFDGVDLVLASAGGSVSASLAPEAVKRGAVVVDNTSHFRLHAQVPLVVGGVNNEALQQHEGIIANPNCSTAQLMPVLKALHGLGELERVVVSTYQSVSGAGKEGLDDCRAEVAHNIMHDTLADRADAFASSGYERKKFVRPIAFNLIPQIDVFEEAGIEAGYTKEELKLIHETKKILALPNLLVTATAVRVPVLVGHSESVTVGFKRGVSVEQAATALRQTPDVVVATQHDDYHTPRETAGTDPVYVSRLRLDTSNPEKGLNFWVVADNLRIGAALNAVRLAESLHEQGLVRVPEQSVFRGDSL